jgi:hypothetical protein
MGERDDPAMHPTVCAACRKEIDPAAGMYHSPDLRQSYHPDCYDVLNTSPTMVILVRDPVSTPEGLPDSTPEGPPAEEGTPGKTVLPRALGDPPSLRSARPAAADKADDVKKRRAKKTGKGRSR